MGSPLRIRVADSIVFILHQIPTLTGLSNKKGQRDPLEKSGHSI